MRPTGNDDIQRLRRDEHDGDQQPEQQAWQVCFHVGLKVVHTARKKSDAPDAYHNLKNARPSVPVSRGENSSTARPLAVLGSATSSREPNTPARRTDLTESRRVCQLTHFASRLGESSDAWHDVI